ncbi:MAG: DUF2017 family protein [Actinobacteria bacterium]|nr:DUF2017 family protein [Actinomycetota bacterium]
MVEFKGSPAAGDLSVPLSIDELHILIDLIEQLLQLLGEESFNQRYQSDDSFDQFLVAAMEDIQSTISQPEDPVLKRLLPNAYPDPESADEFRKYTEPALRKLKQDHLLYLRQQLVLPADHKSGRADIAISDPTRWLIAINDLRLALSVRLNIDQRSFENYKLMPDTDQQKPLFAVFFWLGGIQENLLNHLWR